MSEFEGELIAAKVIARRLFMEHADDQGYTAADLWDDVVIEMGMPGIYDAGHPYCVGREKQPWCTDHSRCLLVENIGDVVEEAWIECEGDYQEEDI